jgi:hypothetical protein
MQPTKQVHDTNFQLNTKPMLAMNFAPSSFRQLERLDITKKESPDYVYS